MNNKTKKVTLIEWLVSLPSFAWLFLFFLIPTIIVILIAFRPSSPYGDILPGWTLHNFAAINKPYYLIVIWRTIWISVLSTISCLLIAIPVGYYMARLSTKWKQLVMVLVIVPFWTNFLVRIFSWQLVLNPEGILKKILLFLGLVNEHTMLLYQPGTVILVIIYTYLPFAILPIFAAAEKFDFSLIEAAHDLGAGRRRAFFFIFIPGISKSLKVATFMVLIPCLGSYVIPDIVGGTGCDMIGNIIASRAFVARNIPMAAAWSSILMIIILVPFGIVLSSQILSWKKRTKIDNKVIGVNRK